MQINGTQEMVGKMQKQLHIIHRLQLQEHFKNIKKELVEKQNYEMK